MVPVLFWVAAGLALGFSVVLFMRYQARRSPFYFWWAISFVLYAWVYAADASTVDRGWTLPWYHVYIIASAGVVGTMSVGTGFLAFARPMARGYALGIGLVGICLLISTVFSPISLPGSWLTLNAGVGGITGVTRVAYVATVSVGGTIVVIGSLWAWWKFRCYYTLLIAVGATVSGLEGSLASQRTVLSMLPTMNIVGLLLMLAGYLLSVPNSSPLQVGTNRKNSTDPGSLDPPS